MNEAQQEVSHESCEKLALHGMRGRRKDTRVLALVIVMSFYF